MSLEYVSRNITDSAVFLFFFENLFYFVIFCIFTNLFFHIFFTTSEKQNDIGPDNLSEEIFANFYKQTAGLFLNF